MTSLVVMMIGMTLGAADADTVRTRVVVRAVAEGAKILHDDVGGARITIADARTGAVLAEGTQAGGPGDTDRIMQAARGTRQWDDAGAASFTAELLLTGPTVVTVTAEGPLRPAHSAMKASKTLLLLPGQHVLGDGIVLELQGLIVNAGAPPRAAPGAPFTVTANVEMMCGCAISAGGRWEADSVQVEARVLSGERVVSTMPLLLVRTSTFSGLAGGLPAGEYELEVTGFQRGGSNAGMQRRRLQVEAVAGVRTEEVRFPAGDISVGGTLFLPDGPGPHPALVWAHGSEPGTRNDGGKRQFAERLAQWGVGVLLADKRGAGATTGSYVETEWLQLLSADQQAGIEYLRSRPDVRRDRVGAMGMSQGGWVSQISAGAGVASFAISISGPGVTPLEQVIAQRINEQVEDGVSAEEAAELTAWWRRLWTYYGTGVGYDAVVSAARALPDRPRFARVRQGAVPTPAQIGGANYEFYRKLAGYDPDTTLAAIRVPFLAVFGENDRHIPMPASADRAAAALRRGGNPAATVVVLEGAGHGLQPTEFERLRNRQPGPPGCAGVPAAAPGLAGALRDRYGMTANGRARRCATSAP